MSTNDDGIPTLYFEEPFSLPVMETGVRSGLIALGSVAASSLVFTTALLGFITWRMISWRSHYSSFIGRNQCLLLIYQLVLADFVQSLGFVISFHWAGSGSLVGPSGSCFAQGWLIQFGDVSSAFFVLAIALHTIYQVILSRHVTYQCFVAGIISVWVVSLLLTTLAPIIGGRLIFLRAGAWCWISSEHNNLRLLLHYLWIFIVQFGCILLYSAGFYYLFRSKRSSTLTHNGGSAVEALNKAARAMLAYALVYTILTLPLAAGRMATMAGVDLPTDYFFFAGALFTSAGWVDTVLYAFTRRTLLFNELNPDGRRGDERPRQGSTDHILERSNSYKMGGIRAERTIKVEMAHLDDDENGVAMHGGTHLWSVSTKGTSKANH